MTEQPETACAGPCASDIGCINLHWCCALLDGLTTAGLNLLVLSPGSRSTPVVLAAQRQPELEILPILDERSAAFFALGAATASNRPVALLATSGSAPAHWYPAVIEASEAGVPLILLSADRPPRLSNWGANQTIDQTRLFGAFVRESHDPGLPLADPKAIKAMRALGLRTGSVSQGPRPGPVHINLHFDEPLIPAKDCPTAQWFAASRDSADRISAGGCAQSENADFSPVTSSTFELPAGRGLILCGPGRFGRGFAVAVQRCAERRDLPILADPLSGLRFGPDSDGIITNYDAFLRNAATAAALCPDWVLRFGHAPVSKPLGEWLDGIPTLLVDPTGGWSDPNHDVVRRLCIDPATFCDACRAEAGRDQGRNIDRDRAASPSTGQSWRERWQAADRATGGLADRYLALADWCEGHVVRALLARIPAGEALLCANSMPIRQFDTWSGTRSSALTLYCNRGVSGIDGQLSTLAGLSHAGVPTWGLLGDLSLCHDLSGLLQTGRIQRPIVVINNGGGRIFDYLPQHGLPGFSEFWRTPVELDLGALAGSFGLRHVQVQAEAAFARTLAYANRPTEQPLLIEILIDGDRSREIHQDFWARAAKDSS